MARLPFNALQKAVYDQLVSESASWQVAAKVYDDVPENEPFPYVELGQFTDLGEDTKSIKYSHTVQAINVWSELRGTRQLNAVLDQVVEALVNNDLIGDIDDDFRIYHITRAGELTEVFKVLDPARGAVIRQGTVRIRFDVEDKLSG